MTPSTRPLPGLRPAPRQHRSWSAAPTGLEDGLRYSPLPPSRAEGASETVPERAPPPSMSLDEALETLRAPAEESSKPSSSVR